MLNEPLRVYLYGVVGAVVAVLVGYGILDGDQALLWIAVGSAVLGIGGVESARNRVTPTAKLDRK